MKKYASRIYLALIFAILYIPIITVIFFSFNAGESTAELRERIASFMRMLEKEQAENIAVFAHAGVLRTFLGLVLGEAVPIKKLLCKNCTVAVFEYRNGTWMLHSWINPD